LPFGADILALVLNGGLIYRYFSTKENRHFQGQQKIFAKLKVGKIRKNK
jgi:hypothetical protein